MADQRSTFALMGPGIASGGTVCVASSLGYPRNQRDLDFLSVEKNVPIRILHT